MDWSDQNSPGENLPLAETTIVSEITRKIVGVKLFLELYAAHAVWLHFNRASYSM